MAHYRGEEFIRKFGRRVQQLRKEQGISQKELAFRTGFELSQIGRIERGEVSTSISHLAAIAGALSISPKLLLDFDHQS